MDHIIQLSEISRVSVYLLLLKMCQQWMVH